MSISIAGKLEKYRQKSLCQYLYTCTSKAPVSAEEPEKKCLKKKGEREKGGNTKERKRRESLYQIREVTAEVTAEEPTPQASGTQSVSICTRVPVKHQ